MDIKQIKGVWEAFLEVQEKKLSPKQKKHFDKDNDGDIDAEDMAALRAKKEGYGKMKKEDKNCGCGKDPCETYGVQKEEEGIKPHKMYKGDKVVMAKDEDDHNRLKKQGYTHDDPKTKKTEEGYGSKKMKESNLFSDEEIAAIEEKADAHTKGATKPEGIMDKESPKAKEFADQSTDIDGEKHKDFDEKGHDDASKAGRPTSQASARKGDNLSNGDSKTPPKPKTK